MIIITADATLEPPPGGTKRPPCHVLPPSEIPWRLFLGLYIPLKYLEIPYTILYYSIV